MSQFKRLAAQPLVLTVLVALCAAIEIGVTLGDLFAPSLQLRRHALIFGAVWPFLWHGTEGLYAGQRLVMLVSHAFLHGGFLHMLFNMLIMVHLGRVVVWRIGSAGFLLVFALTAVAGALTFIAINGGIAPMVGASGVVFGLFGVTMFWDIQGRRALGAPLGPVWRTAVGLVLMNVILWVLTSGALAWETHLGGFVAGAAIAWAVTPTMRHRIGRPLP
ncbi:MAG: rhomboid family intramembrane serine protease [Paracoccaceae bacterium]